MLKFWRENRWMAGLVALIRIVLGFQWLTSGWGKVVGENAFNAAGYLNNAVTNPVLDKATGEALYPTYNAFIENVALPNVKIINFIIPWGEVLVGIGLILGGLTLTAAFFGLLMNFMFMFAGTVSTNPWLLLLGFVVILAGANAGRYGLDRYLNPWLYNKVGRKLLAKFGKGNDIGAAKDTALK